MTIDQRLEALTMNLELQAHETESLRQVVAEQGRNIAAQGSNIDKLIATMQKALDSVNGLTAVADDLLERVEDLEGGAA